MTPSIATLTMNPVVDLFTEVDRMLPDHKLRCLTPRYGPGGGGINVSRAIRRLGAESLALFPAGGATGAMLTTLLERESIRTDVIHTDSATRQNVNVHERATGSEYRLILPGEKLGIDDWNHCLRALLSIDPPPAYVIASGSLPPGVPADFFRRLASIARQRQFRLVVDTAGEPLRHIGNGTYLLKPNLGELAYAAGHQGLLPQTVIEQAARALVAAGRAEVIVVSAGAAGAIVADRSGVRRFAAPAVDAVSRIGAGDSMVAGLVLALTRGWSVDDAVQYGIAAGAAAVSLPGHQLCSLDATERLYAAGRSLQPA